MHVFIDESGIHKPFGRSTVALVFVAVADLEKLNNIIIKTERSLKIEYFHWNAQVWKIRRAFLEAVCRENFTVKVGIIQNPFSKESFQSSLAYFLKNNSIKKVIIDGKKPKQYIYELNKILRQHGVYVKKVKTANDSSYPCLRLADLFAGLLRCYFEKPHYGEARNLYKITQNKITIHVMDDYFYNLPFRRSGSPLDGV